VLINWLLMACRCRHYEARQKPEAPECWHHLTISSSPEICRASTKACKQVRAKSYSRTKRHYLVKIKWWIYTTISVWAKRTLTRGRWIKIAQKFMLQKNYNPRQSREHPCDVRAFQFSPSCLRIWLLVQL